MPPTPVEGVGFQRSRWSVRVCATRSWRAASSAQPPWVTCRLTNASSTRSYWATTGSVAIRPACESLVTNPIPDRPRATRSRKKVSQPAPSSAEVT